jgi:hypothetical protein
MKRGAHRPKTEKTDYSALLIEDAFSTVTSFIPSYQLMGKRAKRR